MQLTTKERKTIARVRAKGCADTTAEVDAVAKALVLGEITMAEIRLGGCPKCGGKLHSDPTPDWMNRWTCAACGKSCSQ